MYASDIVIGTGIIYCTRSGSQTVFQYDIKPLCHSVQIYQYCPGIVVILRVIAV